MEEPDFFDTIKELEKKITTPEELSEYVALLEEGYRAGAWETQTVMDYVGGIEGVLEGLDGLCKNYGYEYPEQPTWAWMGRILRIAFAHS
ncbi:hypothetical protein JCM17960_10880 [Magnetospira thiophila]